MRKKKSVTITKLPQHYFKNRFEFNILKFAVTINKW